MTAIELRQQAPITVPDMQQMARAMAKSGFFGFKTEEQALSIMLIAQASGQHPASAALDYDVIQGRPAKKPQAMLREFLGAGGKVEWHESTDAAADATFSHPRGGSIRVRWDMQRAQQMGLSGKDNYRKQPGVMFRWRCVSEGVRIVYPGATAGMYTPDEVLDLDTIEHVRPHSVTSVRNSAMTKAYPEDQFTKNLPSWESAISSGRKTADEIIGMVQTKGMLTEDQMKMLRDCEQPREYEQPNEEESAQ